jgi:hypothetical protein
MWSWLRVHFCALVMETELEERSCGLRSVARQVMN